MANSFTNKSSNTLRLGNAAFMRTNDLDDRRGVANAVEESFSEFLNEKISLDEYVRIAETSSSQNNALLMELAYSDAPQEWQETYINRIASLKSFESYIIETMVIANLISSDGEQEQIAEIMKNIEKLKEESVQYAEMANSSKP